MLENSEEKYKSIVYASLVIPLHVASMFTHLKTVYRRTTHRNVSVSYSESCLEDVEPKCEIYHAQVEWVSDDIIVADRLSKNVSFV